MVSPNTLYQDFSKLKSKLGVSSISGACKKVYTYFYLILVLYPILTISLLLYLKPDIILEKKIFDDIDLDGEISLINSPRKYRVSYSKLISAFVVLQFPLLIYLIFMK